MSPIHFAGCRIKITDLWMGTKYIFFQTWEFKGDLYDLSMYMIIDDGTSKATTKVFRSTYYAISVDRLIELLSSAGFSNVKRVESDHYQPIIIGTKKGYRDRE